MTTTITRSQAVARIADRTVQNCRDHDLGHAQLGIPNPPTKFEVSSSSSFRDIAL